MTRPDDLDEDDLLAYQRGEAPPETAARIEAAAEGDAGLRAELAVMGGLKGALDAASDSPDMRSFGWRRLEAEIKLEDRVVPAPRGQIWRVAAMILGALVLGQGTYIALVPGSGDTLEFRTVSSETAAFVLAIGFAPEARADQIEALLRETGTRIVDGPSAIGLYRVAFADAQALDRALAAFDAAPIVALVAEE